MTLPASIVTIHMVCSLDGFIAKPDGSVTWLQSTDTYDQGTTLTDADIKAFLENIDCYVMGAKTYETAIELGWPYGDVPVFVITTRTLTADRKNVQFCTGDLRTIVNDQLRPKYPRIWMVGGATLTREFLRQNLADEIVISIVPVLLGEGTPFFDQVKRERVLHLKDVVAYKDGMVELTYEILKGE